MYVLKWNAIYEVFAFFFIHFNKIRGLDYYHLEYNIHSCYLSGNMHIVLSSHQLTRAKVQGPSSEVLAEQL